MVRVVVNQMNQCIEGGEASSGSGRHSRLRYRHNHYHSHDERLSVVHAGRPGRINSDQ